MTTRVLLTGDGTVLFQGDGASVFILDGESPFRIGDDGVGGPKAKKKKREVIRLADADRETTAEFIKAQLKLRQGFPEADPVAEIREKKQKRVIVVRNKREAKMRAEAEAEAERKKAEILKVNAQILQLIAMTHDA